VLLRGTALAVAALVITRALMTGYSNAIATAFQCGNAHMLGFALGSLEPVAADGLRLGSRGTEDPPTPAPRKTGGAAAPPSWSSPRVDNYRTLPT
jgi:hypothetical protein